MAARRAFIAVCGALLIGAHAVAEATDRGTLSRNAAAALGSPAMSAMLRADRDKDGVLTREELDQYDLTLGRRFTEADADANGKLTLFELETVLGPSDSGPVGATR